MLGLRSLFVITAVLGHCASPMPAAAAPLPGGAAVPGAPGYHLHAAELGFRHPRTDEPLVVTAPLPAGDPSA